MAAFGAGAALPLLLLGLVSREVMLRWRSTMLHAGHGGKAILGALLFANGFLILSNLDRNLETFMVEISPPWLTHLTTKI